MKKLLSLVLMITICFGLVSLNVSAAKVPTETETNDLYRGACGENVKWSLDTATGILKITGTGNMDNYTNSARAPWYNSKYYIKTINIELGVTSIGNSAFEDCTN